MTDETGTGSLIWLGREFEDLWLVCETCDTCEWIIVSNQNEIDACIDELGHDGHRFDIKEMK